MLVQRCEGSTHVDAALAEGRGLLILTPPADAKGKDIAEVVTRRRLIEDLHRLWTGRSPRPASVLVTHDIEEALFLSDRIVVLNDGPASTIREIVEVHLPRPRNKIEIVKMPEYIELRDRLLHLLTDKFSIEDMGMKYQN